MFRPYPLFVGLRYTRAKRRNHFISFISLTSMLGIALGVMALITVLSVMNGFEAELRDRILGMASHLTLTQATGEGLAGWQALARQVRDRPGVAGVAPFVRQEVMLSRNGRVSGAVLRGVLPDREARVSTVARHMVAGRLADLRPGGYGIVLGNELAWALGVGVGDRVTVVTPEAAVTPAGILPRLKRFRVVGIFKVGMYEYDRGVALVQLQDAQKLFHLDNRVSGLRVRLDDLFQAPRLRQQLAGVLPPTVRIRDWTQEHANFFRAVHTEKRVMFIILTLIVAVAAFNIVSTLVMVVTDKQADIAILRTLGATPGAVMTIFIVQGALIGLVGTLLGVIGGVALATHVETLVPLIERTFHVQFLSPDVYYISELPSQLRWPDVVHIGGLALVLSLTATLYPAWRASRTQPAEALRYE